MVRATITCIFDVNIILVGTILLVIGLITTRIHGIWLIVRSRGRREEERIIIFITIEHTNRMLRKDNRQAEEDWLITPKKVVNKT
jgi:hypothetical protein